MEDRTLKSELYNNIKFNMQKLIFDVPKNDSERLSEIMDASDAECHEMIAQFDDQVKQIAEKIRHKMIIPIAKKESTIAFIGDSITSDRESFFNIIQELYKDQENMKFIDAAVSGYKSDDVVMRLFTHVLNQKPNIAHILIGTNDLRRNDHELGKSCISLEEIESNINYLIRSLCKENVHVVISTISPVINEKLKIRFPDDNWVYNMDEINKCNHIIVSAAKRNDVKINDMRPVYANYRPEELLLADGLHLNGFGQTLLAQNVLIALSEFFN